MCVKNNHPLGLKVASLQNRFMMMLLYSECLSFLSVKVDNLHPVMDYKGIRERASLQGTIEHISVCPLFGGSTVIY